MDEGEKDVFQYMGEDISKLLSKYYESDVSFILLCGEDGKMASGSDMLSNVTIEDTIRILKDMAAFLEDDLKKGLH